MKVEIKQKTEYGLITFSQEVGKADEQHAQAWYIKKI